MSVEITTPNEKEAAINKWMELMYKSYGDNGAIGCIVMLMIAFKQAIHVTVGLHPVPAVYGLPATGKTSWSFDIIYFFYRNEIYRTDFKFRHLFELNNQRIMIYDQYQSTISKETMQRIREAYQNAGSDHKRKKGFVHKENETLIITSQTPLPFSDSSVLSKTLVLPFNMETQNEQSKKAFAEFREYKEIMPQDLKSELEKHADNVRESIMELMFSNQMSIDIHFKHTHTKFLSHGLKLNYALLLALVDSIESGIVGNLRLPFDKNAFFSLCIKQIQLQQQLENN